MYACIDVCEYARACVCACVRACVRALYMYYMNTCSVCQVFPRE